AMVRGVQDQAAKGFWIQASGGGGVFFAEVGNRMTPTGRDESPLCLSKRRTHETSAYATGSVHEPGIQTAGLFREPGDEACGRLLVAPIVHALRAKRLLLGGRNSGQEQNEIENRAG